MFQSWCDKLWVVSNCKCILRWKERSTAEHRGKLLTPTYGHFARRAVSFNFLKGPCPSVSLFLGISRLQRKTALETLVSLVWLTFFGVKNITVELIMSCLGGFVSDILLREKIATTVCSEYDIFWYEYTIQSRKLVPLWHWWNLLFTEVNRLWVKNKSDRSSIV